MSKPEGHGTIVASAGVTDDPTYRGVAPPLWASDTFEWDGPEDKPDYDYSRTVSPNRDLLARAIAELEGGKHCAVTNSGQSAALLALLQLEPGATVLAPHDCYGGTYRLLQGLERKGLVRPLFVDQNDDDMFAMALQQDVRLVWLESPSNPLLRLVPIAQRCAQAKSVGALTICDNTLLTPCRQQPLKLGADLVLHSTTKAINGHNDLFGGALISNDDGLAEQIAWWANAAGLSGSAYDSWQTLRGMRTLPLRVARQEETALKLAQWLEGHPQVAAVHYPGLESFPQRALVEAQQSGPGFMVSFRVNGSVALFAKAPELITLASSLGGFATLVCTPASMTHRGMPPEAQAEAGITPDLIRMSVGLEDADDLIGDLSRGFAAL
ncbi:O-succinylhomoserine (thiol)-lyase [Sphingomonas piscis]|uniref:O-succinylhomoserine (Thiol)-lyase n=1 Tax=Sphingomonas piscis TaxID=2714943 RepID=A0A6G7YQZ6_9SPHN|nr:PLP-dependent transferase [Sphingomonas piscis]QIK79161.1 O-succinylhomoserine (thiol)-lyase [Sphingomonas piscis]